jgi:hypothetical protein
MKTMHNDTMRKTVKQLRELPLPACPADLEATVLRRIRLENAELEAKGSVLEGILALFQQPRFTALLLLFTSVTAATTTAVAAQLSQPTEVKAETLGLDAISQPGSLECFHFPKHH